MAGKLLSGREAAKVLGISHQTVYNWIKTCDLVPTHYSNTGPLFDPDYIREFAKRLELERNVSAQPVA